MRVVLSWLREHVPGLPEAEAVAAALTRIGLEVERVEAVGREVSGVVVGEVADVEVVRSKNKQVRWVRVRVGEDGTRGVICGASNFGVGDRVPVALPGAVLPGGVRISARAAYGRMSDGMICSARELGVGDDHTSIVVLAPQAPVGAEVATLLGLRDEVLDVAVLPDRGYALSVRGLAREAATALGLTFHDPADVVLPEPSAAGAGYQVRVEDPVGCDRYVARVVTGVDPAAPSPLELARRLTLSGMRPISLAVDVTNGVMLGLGQPLHAFGRAALSGPIVVRRARAGERLVTLDGVDRALHPDDLVIADDTGPVALAGVMGGEATEIGPGTTDIVLESAHFDPASVARTARRHGLSSEAARRFERGVDPALAPYAAQAAVRSLVALGGAAAPPAVTDVDLRPPPPRVAFPLGETERLVGRPYDPQVVRSRLADVGCTVGGGDPLEVVPPSWRPDLTRPADLVEEVVRLEGYDTVPVRLPRAAAGRGLTTEQRLRRQAAHALASAGYVEVLTVPFVGADVADRLGLPDGDGRRAAVRLANPIAEDAAYLRTTLLPGLFAAVVRNVGRGEPDLSLSEVGLVFRARPGVVVPPSPPVDRRPTPAQVAALDAALPSQPRHAAVVLTGRRDPAGWWGPGRPADWSDAVEAARVLARAVRADLEVARGDAMPWHPGRCAALRVAGAVVGYAGELHPRVVAAFDLPARACAMELDLDALVAAADPPVSAPRLSAYPPADRDVALVVDVTVPEVEVEEALRGGAGELLESLRLFDVYDSPQLGQGRRSLAFGLRFRAPDRTLTAEEANAARDAAIAAARRRTGATPRS
ncbi:MAG TPA: phenylalanine--tRNA ligase subunit beta [Frankiaceae bacterium]|nr:phenylalanine--tRNA ligase subunit beta [Frankiaceae bacterium]